MPPPSERTTAFQSAVVYNLGAAAGVSPRWNGRTTVPTLASFAPVRALAARRNWAITAWLFEDGEGRALEVCEGRWRPAMAAIAFAPSAAGAPSVAASLAAFNEHIRPLAHARRTRTKYLVHRLSILTWAIWKGVLPVLLPMSDDLLRAYIWEIGRASW